MTPAPNPKRSLLDEHHELATHIRTIHTEADAHPKALQNLQRACKRMIEIAPHVIPHLSDSKLPSHVGYERLIIIHLQQGKHEEANRLQREYKGVWRQAPRYLNARAPLAHPNNTVAWENDTS